MSIVYGPQPLRSLNTEMRHGFEDQYQSEELLEQLAQNFIFYFDDKRHLTNGIPTPEEERQADTDRNYQPIPDWKVSRGRQKTVSAALLLCLNLGVDPPDIVKTRPCARKEAWVDPLSFQDSKKAIEQIGRNLQSQYETLSSRTRYKQSLDPCVEDVKRFCNSLRRTSKDDQILFHYNGHGVPQPTTSGEIWVFNRGYTQYIPVSLYDLQTWLGAPCVFVYDCSSAGNIVTNFKKFVEKRCKDDELGCHDMAAPSPTSAYLECFQLASCREGELLPMHPELPADLFTCCLTCPIEISIRVFLMQSKLKSTKYRPLFEQQLYPYNKYNNSASGSSEEKMFSSIPNISIPGSLSDRRTPLGELNWIFTAITDTIAWTSLPRPLFKKLFRHDLMMAALFRNFLLAKRIMPWYNCHPVSDPELPDTVAQHPLWKSWDLAIDEVLGKLVKDLQESSSSGSSSSSIGNTGGNLGAQAIFQQQEIFQNQQQSMNNIKFQHQQQQQREEPSGSIRGQSRFAVGNLSTMSLSTYSGLQTGSASSLSTTGLAKNSAAMVNSLVPQPLQQQQQFTGFFERNLSAFELWLKYESYQHNPPEQLPIVLQVLLSQVHRVRALVLLSRFLDLGPWAVYLSLSIGIFPYILKLLQSPAPELKPILVFIWARIMSVDYKNTQVDLAKERGFMYFINILTPDFGSTPTSLYGTPLTARPSSHSLAITPQQHIFTATTTSKLTSSSNETTDEQKSMSVFVLASFVRDFPLGQKYCFDVELLKKLCFYIEASEVPLLRQWCLILIGLLYEQNPLHKYISMNVGIFDVLLKSLGDPVPEVRAAVIYALRCFISDSNDTERILRLRQELEQQSQQLNAQLLQLLNNSTQTKQNQQQHTEQQQMKLEHQLNVCTSLQAQLECIDLKVMKTRAISNLIAVLAMINDGSPLVRKEILVYFSQVVHRFLNFFIIVAFNELVEDIAQFEGLDPDTVNYFEKHSVTYGSIFNTVWKALLIFAGDPYIEIRKMAGDIIDCILSELRLHKDLGELFSELETYYLKRNVNVNSGTRTGFSTSKAQIRSFTPGKRFENSVDGGGNGSKLNRSRGLPGAEYISTSTTSDRQQPQQQQQQQNSLRSLSLKGLFRTLTLRDASGQDESASLINPDEKRATGISLLSVAHGVAQIPSTPRFHLNQSSETTAAELPFKSTFFDYCREYFQEPQMRKPESEEVGSKAYNRRIWRRNRNETIIETTQAQKKLALYGDWSNKLVTLDNKTQPKLLRFTQFEDQLVVADDRDNISVFDWREKKMLSRFSNGNPFGTKITDMQFVNEDDETLVMTGSSDGVVKIYKDAWSNEKVTTVAAWRVLTEMLLTPRSNGLILEWQQIRGSLLATGDVKIIRIWDAHTETVEVDIPAKTSALITSLTSDQLVGNVFVGGFSDGTLRVYDRRMNTRNSMVRRWRTQGGGRDVWINNVHMQRGGYRELVSGATNGVVELWDIRAEDPVKTFIDENTPQATGNGKRAMTMTSTQIHEHAPIIASSTKQIKIWTTSGDRLSSFKNLFGGIGNSVVANTIAGAAGIRNTLSYTSFSSNSFVSALEFHPHRMMLAAANSHDTRINIFDCVSRNQSYY